MKRIFVKHKGNLAQFGKFMAVGVANFVVDYGILYLLSTVAGFPTAPSNVVSYTCGLVNSFILNRYWTFKQKLSFFSAHFVKFVFVNLISLGVNTLAVWILVELYGFTDGVYGMENLYAKLIATVFSFTVNFAGNKLLVFKDDNAHAMAYQDIKKKPEDEE